jgi:hypothetical protein
VRMTELFFSSTCGLSFPWYGRERGKVIPRAMQKRVRCPGADSLPLSECRERTRPGYLRRQDASAATTTTSAFVCTSASPLLRPSGSWQDSSAGEAAASHHLHENAHAPFWFSTKSGMPPAISCLLTEIIQHHRFLDLPCLQIYLCLDHRELPPFLHRELRSRYSSLVRKTSSILSSFTSVFS